jgi:hypothetical protein
MCLLLIRCELFHSYLYREAEHLSTNNPTQHYSVFELDKNNNVIASKHYYK